MPFRAVSEEVRLLASACYTMHEYRAALDVLDGGQAGPGELITDAVPLSALPAVFKSLRKRTSQCKVLVRPAGLVGSGLVGPDWCAHGPRTGSTCATATMDAGGRLGPRAALLESKEQAQDEIVGRPARCAGINGRARK